MRRAEILEGIKNITKVIGESKLWRLLRRGRFGKRESEESTTIELFESFRTYTLLSASFGEVENVILDAFELSRLSDSSFWAELPKREGAFQQAYSGCRLVLEFLPKFSKLLEQEYLEEIQSDSEDVPKQLKGKEVLTVVLPEEHGQFSTASRFVELVDSINLMYESFLEVYDLPREPLILLACDSGSDKSFDFAGVAKVVECVKDLILALWDRVVFYRERLQAERLRLIKEEMIPILESIGALPNKDTLPPELLGKVTHQITESTLRLIEVGITIPEMSQRSAFEPRQLMAAEPKLLMGTPDSEPIPQIQTTAEIDDDEDDELSNVNDEEKELLKKMLKMLREGEGRSQSKSNSEDDDEGNDSDLDLDLDS